MVCISLDGCIGWEGNTGLVGCTGREDWFTLDRGMCSTGLAEDEAEEEGACADTVGLAEDGEGEGEGLSTVTVGSGTA